MFLKFYIMNNKFCVKQISVWKILPREGHVRTRNFYKHTVLLALLKKIKMHFMSFLCITYVPMFHSYIVYVIYNKS